ncbi:MAG: hypothetical protein NTW21_36050, partial [Verrucomicrobia bacterium]|nr:hypothetical protein [Verrucomicrobiota bacterium]
VDDTPANVLLLVRMLAERGYRPRPVSSGKLALEAARAEPPDLILLDILSPWMKPPASLPRTTNGASTKLILQFRQGRVTPHCPDAVLRVSSVC